MPVPGTVLSQSVVSRVTLDAVKSMSSNALDAAVVAAYPEFNKDVALAYIDGARLCASMVGLAPDAMSTFIGQWAQREEYMLVASLYATARARREDFLASLSPPN